MHPCEDGLMYLVHLRMLVIHWNGANIPLNRSGGYESRRQSWLNKPVELLLNLVEFFITFTVKK